jgi:hypothetical protein
MRLIPLTRGQFAKVDDEDFEFLSQWKWHALKQPHTFYAARNVTVDGKRKTIWMHRVVNKTPEGLLTDHKNGDGLDNQRHNLRSATHQDNMVNCARHRAGSSKYRGVSWHVSNRCWIAQITINYRYIYIGRFETEEEAHAAYQAKRQELRAGQLIRTEEAA